MQPIDSYKIVWNTKANEGIILVHVPDGVRQLHFDNAVEGKMMLDKLRSDDTLYIENGLVYSGFADIGIGEVITEIQKDKLRIVEGIGPKIEGLLNDRGIYTFQQLAGTPLETLQKILTNAGPRYRIHDPGTWSKQAAMAATGKTDELKEWQKVLKGGK